MEIKDEITHVSLYEFLGKPAGGDLGKQIYYHARKIGVKVETKEISNSKYSGKVMMYPVGFLTDYFASYPLNDEFPTLEEYENSRGFEDDDDLPF